MKLKNGFITHDMSGETLLIAVGAAAKDFHGMVRLNETAACIVKCLRQETTPEEMADVLLTEYDVDRATAEKDVSRLLAKLREIEAIEE